MRATTKLFRCRNRVGVLPERAARLFCTDGRTVVADLPLGVGPLVESLWWNPSHEREPAHLWLRRLAAEAGEAVVRRP
jgi:hypothetical protein